MEFVSKENPTAGRNRIQKRYSDVHNPINFFLGFLAGMVMVLMAEPLPIDTYSKLCEWIQFDKSPHFSPAEIFICENVRKFCVFECACAKHLEFMMFSLVMNIFFISINYKYNLSRNSKKNIGHSVRIISCCVFSDQQHKYDMYTILCFVMFGKNSSSFSGSDKHKVKVRNGII